MSKANNQLLKALNYHMELKGKAPIDYFMEIYGCRLVNSYTKGDIFVGTFISQTGVEFTIHTFENKLVTRLYY